MSAIDREAAARDLEVHQLRVLSLIHAVAALPETAGKIDSLTKLAKLDFLVRYPDAREAVHNEIEGVDSSDPPVKASPETGPPMIRHRFGPWDDSYYPVIGALVGRGLAKYVRARNRAVGVALTRSGDNLYERVVQDPAWRAIASEAETVANEFGAFTGNRLKDAIYAALPEMLDVPHRTELSQ